MPKLRVLSGRDVCKILAQYGFEEIRQKGDKDLRNTLSWVVVDKLSTAHRPGVPSGECQDR